MRCKEGASNERLFEKSENKMGGGKNRGGEKLYQGRKARRRLLYDVVREGNQVRKSRIDDAKT